jgi:hypothetical protein
VKASIRQVLTTKVGRGNEWAREWDEAELVERLESLEAKAAGPETFDQLALPLAHAPAARGAWWTLPLLALLILAPWAVIATIVWLLAG